MRSESWRRFATASPLGSYLRHTFGVEEFLESGEHLPDLVRRSEVRHGVGDGVVVFELQQRAEFFLIEFLNANRDVKAENALNA